jgi:hypothetical protein
LGGRRDKFANMKSPEEYQILILTMEDGRKLYWTGPAELKEGDIISKIEILLPKPLPEGCSWERFIIPTQ